MSEGRQIGPVSDQGAGTVAEACPSGEQVLEHRDRLLRVAYLMLGNREDAEDATQRTLLKALGLNHLARDREVAALIQPR